ncbi:MAG TPA: hypothetical protein VKK79_02060 [Candidatus Lokiarchaeia archaeon]|nr:hypothetical protein [Candidatus Lokiarchaeia archaeon]
MENQELWVQPPDLEPPPPQLAIGVGVPRPTIPPEELLLKPIYAFQILFLLPLSIYFFMSVIVALIVSNILLLIISLLGILAPGFFIPWRRHFAGNIQKLHSGAIVILSIEVVFFFAWQFIAYVSFSFPS